MTREWWSAGNRWLEAKGLEGYRVWIAAHVKACRNRSTYRWSPPDWHRDSVAALGRNDEESFKAIKLANL
jgi:hypothetical protein